MNYFYTWSRCKSDLLCHLELFLVRPFRRFYSKLSHYYRVKVPVYISEFLCSLKMVKALTPVVIYVEASDIRLVVVFPYWYWNYFYMSISFRISTNKGRTLTVLSHILDFLVFLYERLKSCILLSNIYYSSRSILETDLTRFHTSLLIYLLCFPWSDFVMQSFTSGSHSQSSVVLLWVVMTIYKGKFFWTLFFFL